MRHVRAKPLLAAASHQTRSHPRGIAPAIVFNRRLILTTFRRARRIRPCTILQPRNVNPSVAAIDAGFARVETQPQVTQETDGYAPATLQFALIVAEQHEIVHISQV